MKRLESCLGPPCIRPPSLWYFVLLSEESKGKRGDGQFAGCH